MLRDDTAARARSRRISIIEAAQQIGLKDLQPSDFIDFSRCAEGLMVRAGEAQVERLKLIGLVARRDIAAYNKCEFMSAEVALEISHVHIGGGKRGPFRRGDLFLQSRRARTGNYFHWIKLPEKVGLGDERVRIPVGGAVR